MRKFQSPSCANFKYDDILTVVKTILLLTRSESSPFRAIRKALLPLTKEYGWAVHSLVADTFDTASSLVKAWNPDGCIIYAAPLSGISGNFNTWRKPVVAINPSCTVQDAITIAHDSSVTGLVAAQELSALHLSNFAFFSHIESQPWVEKRFDSYSKEIGRHGYKVLRYLTGDLGVWLVSLPKPCALFAANDAAAEIIASTAFARGISIPQDIALIACDNDPAICEHAETTISSIRMDFTKCAKLSVEALKCTIEGRHYEGETVYGDNGVTHRASTRLISTKFPVFISSILEYIRLNALHGISVDDVIRHFGASRRTLEYRFRKATGRSILEEIQYVRLDEAKRLAADSSVKLGVIASRVGYSSVNFLERLFKRNTGLSMREYRLSKK